MAERTSIDIICTIGEYYSLIDRARSLPSYFSHGWTPDAQTDYVTRKIKGRAWFTFEKKSDAMLFKLGMILVDRT